MTALRTTIPDVEIREERHKKLKCPYLSLPIDQSFGQSHLFVNRFHEGMITSKYLLCS